MIRKYLFLLILSLIIPFIAIGQTKNTSPNGEKLKEQLSDFIYSSRKIDFETKISHKSEEFINRGFIVANKEKVYLKILGVSEIEYDSEKILAYSEATKELVIQKNKRSNDVINNPFALLQKSDGITVSEPLLENLNGKRVKTIVIKPASKAYYREAKIYMTDSENNSKLVRIDIWGRSGDKYETTVVKYSNPDNSLMKKYYLDISSHPDAKMNDLR